MPAKRGSKRKDVPVNKIGDGIVENGVHLNLRVPAEIGRQIESRAAKNKRSVSAEVREILADGLINSVYEEHMQLIRDAIREEIKDAVRDVIHDPLQTILTNVNRTGHIALTSALVQLSLVDIYSVEAYGMSGDEIFAKSKKTANRQWPLWDGDRGETK